MYLVGDVDALAKLQVGTSYMLNLPGNIEDLEGFQKVPNRCTIFKKDCTVGMLMGARVESLPHDDLLTNPTLRQKGQEKNNKSNLYLFLGHVSAIQNLGVEAVSRRMTRIPGISAFVFRRGFLYVVLLVVTLIWYVCVGIFLSLFLRSTVTFIIRDQGRLFESTTILET